MANDRPSPTGCQSPNPNPLGYPRPSTRVERRLARYLVVARVPEKDRGPFTLLATLAYAKGVVDIPRAARDWGVTIRTVRRWAARALERGWVARIGPGEVRSTPAGREAWADCRKVRLPAELRGQLPPARRIIWAVNARNQHRTPRFHPGTRILAADCRCARSTVQAAWRSPLFGLYRTPMDRYGTPDRWCVTPDYQTLALLRTQSVHPQTPDLKRTSPRRSHPPGTERRPPPRRGGAASVRQTLDSLVLELTSATAAG